MKLSITPPGILSGNPKSKSGPADQYRKLAGLVTLVVACVMCGAVSRAQQPKRVYRIGYLSPIDAARESTEAQAVWRALSKLGYIEGQNIAIEYRYAEGKLDRLPALAAELVGLKVDIIVVAGGNQPIRAAKNATKTIPIVMMGAGPDPVQAGFVQSLARPGGNVTGLSTFLSELGGKRLELLKEAVPKIVRVAALSIAPIPRGVREDLPKVARALGLTLRTWEVRDVDGFEKVFVALNKERPDGLWVHEGRLMADNQKLIAGFALKSRLPSVFPYSEGVVAGGLMYYGADLADSYRRVAVYIDKILNGTKPADLPVERPTKFEFVINLKTAQRIGLDIPQSVLFRADRVIK
jgi:putative ABC transport system substrate-binding protein